MSVETTAPRRGEAAVRSRTFADRFYAALPLLAVFFWLCVLYGWQAWNHRTPWLFGDELEFTQLSRSLADTGHAARRSVPYSVHSLSIVATAPAWWIGDVSRAYGAVKYINVVAMTLTAFPTYFLARRLTTARAALFAAVASVSVPALVYTSFIVEEPFAYTWATLSMLTIVGALVTVRRRWILAALATALIAPLWKGELVVLPIVFLVAAVLMWLSGEAGTRWRSRWTHGDWVSAVVLLFGIVFLASAFAQWRSGQYLEVTRLWKTRVLDHAVKAGGALTVGTGILPTLAAAGLLLPAPGERRSRELRAFRCVLAASLFLFGLYAGIKGAYNQNHFATRVWERNVLYLAPLFFVALAVWLERRRVNLITFGIGVVYVAYVLAKLPYSMINDRFASDAPGMTILSQANRSLAVTPTIARGGLLAILAVCVAILVVPQLVRLSARLGGVLAVFVAVFVVGWSLAGELSAASASNAIGRSFRANIRGNPSWVDHYAKQQPTVYIGQTEQVQPDQNSEWLLEFWNRAIKQVWIIGGCPVTYCGPGPTLTPDVTTPSGLVYPQPGYRYAVVEDGIVPNGTLVARRVHRGGGGGRLWRLYRLHQPLRFKSTTTGRYFDGWSEEPNGTAYTRFTNGKGTLRIRVSRALAGGARSHPYRVRVRLGKIAIEDRQPVMGRVLEERTFTVPSYNAIKTVSLPSRWDHFRVEVNVDPPFVPAEDLPGNGDRRQLGATVNYRFVPRKAAQR